MGLLSKVLPKVRGGALPIAPAPADRSTRAVVDAIAGYIATSHLAQALAVVDEAFVPALDDAQLVLARGSILFAWGRHHEARDWLLRAAGRSSDPAHHAKLGWTCLWLGRVEESCDAMRRATELGPSSWEAHFGLGTALRALKRYDDARAAFERALELNPSATDCLSSLMAVDMDLRSFEAAERFARRAIEVDPDHAGRFADLGVVLSNLGRHDESLEAFRRARELAAGGELTGDDLVNHAICVLRSGRTAEATAIMERAIPTLPSTILQAQYGLALLTCGRFQDGWSQYEFRWADPPLSAGRPNFVKPHWEGQDLRGRSVLLWSEQGFGDFMQFVRYAPSLKALGARVIAFVREELRELAKGVRAIDHILGPNEPYPPFDYYINLLSLPRVFGTTIETIPDAVPYIAADPQRAAVWSGDVRSGKNLNVGIVWAGSPTHVRDHTRSIPLASLAPLFAVPGVRFHSLQKGTRAAELHDQPAAAVIDHEAKLLSFADTAAAIDALDLVISVDTAVVHLAGALGKPVWTLVATPADWRWMEEGETTPWYPTMRLFRQRIQGQWSDVIERVRDALQAMVRSSDVPNRAVGVRSIVAPTAAARESIAARFSRIAETRLGIVQYFPDDEAGESLAYYGEYRQLENERLDALVSNGMTALQTGCGIGARTLWLSRRLGAEGHLFLYESDPLRRQVLQQNLRANGIGNTTLMRNRLESASPTSSTGQEHNETIDDLRLERLDLIVADDPAAAADMLDSAAETLWRCRPRLFVRVRDRADLQAIAQRARDLGYLCFRVETPLFDPRNFSNRETDRFAGRTTVTIVAVPEEHPSQAPGERVLLA